MWLQEGIKSHIVLLSPLIITLTIFQLLSGQPKASTQQCCFCPISSRSLSHKILCPGIQNYMHILGISPKLSSIFIEILLSPKGTGIFFSYCAFSLFIAQCPQSITRTKTHISILHYYIYGNNITEAMREMTPVENVK